MHRPKLAVGINDDTHPARHGLARDACNKGLGLSSRFANSNGVGLAGCAKDVSADINIVTAGREIPAGVGTQTDIVAPCVVNEGPVALRKMSWPPTLKNNALTPLAVL